MSYSEFAQLELANALNNIKSESDLNEFKDLIANFFAQKAQSPLINFGTKELSITILSTNGERNTCEHHTVMRHIVLN